MHQAGEWMDPDLNKYDLHHRVSHHRKMSDAEWEEAYKAAWAAYFTWEHMETVTRRHARLERRPAEEGAAISERVPHALRE